MTTRLIGLYVELVREHRRVVAEHSGNFAGHVAIRDGWVEWDDETRVEDCHTCDLLRDARAALDMEEME